MQSSFIGEDADLEGLGTVVFVAIVGGFIATFWLSLWTLAILLLATLGILYAAVNVFAAGERDYREKVADRAAGYDREIERQHLNDLVSRHSGTLAGRYRMLVSNHGYGGVDQEPWQKEVLRFMLAVDFDPAHMTLNDVATAVAMAIEQQRDTEEAQATRNVTPRREGRFYREASPEKPQDARSKFRPTMLTLHPKPAR